MNVQDIHIGDRVKVIVELPKYKNRSGVVKYFASPHWAILLDKQSEVAFFYSNELERILYVEN